MDKYKICPSCGTINEPTVLECISCECDLTRAKITDEATEKKVDAITKPESVPSQDMIRICECGTKNAPNARKCISCSEDISDITPTLDAVKQGTEALQYIFSSLDGKYAYKIEANEITVGRETIMSEYLSQKTYVSRYHARITVEGSDLFIENLSNTNFTYVNNNKISSKTKIVDGDEIGVGGMVINGKRQVEAAYFLVRIGSCM